MGRFRFTRRRLAALGSLVAVILSTGALGCGGDDGGSGADGGGGTTARAARPAGPHFDDTDCRALRRFLRPRLAGGPPHASAPLKIRLTSSESLSQCAFTNPAVSISAALDVGAQSRQRFKNRIVEAIQFSFDEPAKRPRPVAGVGDPGTEQGGAVWTPSSAQLLAVRGRKLLIVSYYVAGVRNAGLRAGAIAFARAAYAKVSSASRSVMR